MGRTSLTLSKWTLALASSALLISSCKKDDNDTTEVTPEFPFSVPSTYDTAGVFNPAAWNGQATRRDQLGTITGIMRPSPAAQITDNAVKNILNGTSNSSTYIGSKIDENVTGANGNASYTVRNSFYDMADSIELASISFNTTAASGVAGQLGTSRRIVSSKGLEYAQLIEKGLFGACFYDQIVDDYLGIKQAADGPSNKSNSKADNADYDAEGTERQHAFDEAFGYLGAPLDWPTSSGEFLAKYITNVSNTNELSVDLDDELSKAFRVGRAALKAGEGTLSGEDNTDETILGNQIDNIKKYIEYGIVGAAFSYLNDVTTDTDNVDKIHHLSEALAFIYALSFNSDGTISSTEAYAVLEELDWSTDDLTGAYEVDLWAIANDLTNTKVNAAKTELAKSFPELENVSF